ncbi:MAG: hypothetical protein HC925_03200 [Coleofasciculaceae cyanobacterium SM2_3_26]|nr:hypothetical protein [Coleofasciculaceae cyanobacterium SM2_3_26]
MEQRDKTEIEKRLKFFLGFDKDPEEDWFKQNATPELVQKIYGYLSKSERNALLKSLLDELE